VDASTGGEFNLFLVDNLNPCTQYFDIGKLKYKTEDNKTKYGTWNPDG
jgi:hypothetical protein